MMFLTSASVRRPIGTLMMILGVCLGGLIAMFQLPVDKLPNIESNTVTIFVDVRGGMPPEDIEKLVTIPIEDSMATLSGLKEMMSVAKKDQTNISLIFDDTQNVKRATLEVSERLARIKGKLPSEIEKPIIARYNENDHPIIILSATSSVKTPEVLRTMIERDLKPRLSRVSGVANVDIGGGRQRKILVEFEKAKLEMHRISIMDVIQQLGASNISMMSGPVETGQEIWGVNILSQFRTLEDMKELGIAVTKEGSRIRLKDVAVVRDYYLEPESYARVNNQPAVSVYVQKESGANTMKSAKGVMEVVNDYRKTLPPDMGIGVAIDQSVAIRQAISDVRNHLTWGAFLTIFVLWAFLRHLKQVGVILLSIPVAILATFFAMFIQATMFKKFGFGVPITINVMSLLGVALGIGRMVDDSIVVLENILHRYQEAVKKGPVDKMALAVAATKEVALAVASSTLILFVIFLPIIMFSQDIRRLFTDVAFTVIAALSASLLMAITTVPLLASRSLFEEGGGQWDFEKRFEKFMSGIMANLALIYRHHGESHHPIPPTQGGREPDLGGADSSQGKFLPPPPKDGSAEADLWGKDRMGGKKGGRMRSVFGRLQTFFRLMVFHPLMDLAHVLGIRSRGLSLGGLYRGLTAWTLRHRMWVMLGILLSLLFSLYLYVFKMEKEFIGDQEKNEFIIFVELPSGTKLDVSDKVVVAVETEINSLPEVKEVIKTVSARVEGWSSKLYVTLNPEFQRTRTVQDVIDALRPRLKTIGAEYEAFIYFSEPSQSKEVIIDCFGRDYLTLREVAISVAKRIQEVPDLRDVKLRYKPGRPEVRLVVDIARASVFGLNSKDIADSLHAQIRGLRATYFNAGNEQVETIARLSEEDRRTWDKVTNLSFIAQTKERSVVPLFQVADYVNAITPSEIWRRDKERVIQVSANRERLALSTAIEKAKKGLHGLELPVGYHYEFGGDYKKLLKSEQEFMWAFIIMVLLVYMVLACFFESYSQPFIMLFTIPLATAGSLPALWLSRTPVNMGAYIGLLMLGGTVVSNAIILIDRLNAVKGKRGLLMAVLKAGKERARPIFMTSYTTIAAMIPLAFSTGESSDIWAPLAIVVTSGIFLSSMLTLFVIPAAYVNLELFLASWRAFMKGETSLFGAIKMFFKPPPEILRIHTS